MIPGSRKKSQQMRQRFVADEEDTLCRQCRSVFDMLNRKRRCKMCGNAFCATCAPSHAKLPKEFGYDKPKRVCDTCLESLKAMKAQTQVVTYSPYNRTLESSGHKEDRVLLYVNKPSLNGYSLKYVPTTLPIKDKWSSQLPSALRSDRYHLFHNGLQLLNETKTVIQYGLKDGDHIDLKRGFEFELTYRMAPVLPEKWMTESEEKVFLNDKLTVAEVTTILAGISFAHHKNKSLYKYTLIRTGTKAPKPLMIPRSSSCGVRGSGSHTNSFGAPPTRAVPSPRMVVSPRVPSYDASVPVIDLSDSNVPQQLQHSPRILSTDTPPRSPAPERPDRVAPPTPDRLSKNESLASVIPRSNSAQLHMPSQSTQTLRQSQPLTNSSPSRHSTPPNRPLSATPPRRPSVAPNPPITIPMDYPGIDTSRPTSFVNDDNDEQGISNRSSAMGPWEVSHPPGPVDSNELFVRCYFTQGDIINVTAELINDPNATHKVESGSFEITFSPFTEQERQLKTFVKKGILRRWNLYRWVKKWYELSSTKLSCYESSQADAKLLDDLDLTGFIGVTVVEEMPQKTGKKMLYGFTVTAGSKQMQLSDPDHVVIQEWQQKINAMGIISRSLASYFPKTMPEDDTAPSAKEISMPFNARHNLSVGSDWIWQGDVHVFMLGEQVGRGVSGRVLRATVRDTTLEVAIKIVESKNEKVLEELEKEIDILKQCKHKDIVCYYGTKIVEQECWIIMDYCGVGSVKDAMKVLQDTLSEKQIAYILIHTLNGLNLLHQRNVLHMDLKAANILLCENGFVKLADFGVSLVLGKESQFLATNYIGSPLFMAPEVIRKEEITAASDIWSLGVTLIELAEGQPPNMDVNCIEMLPLLLDRDYALKNPRLFSVQFKNILSRCLNKDKAQRPSALQLTNDGFLNPDNVPGPECLKEFISDVMSIRARQKRK